MRQLSGSRIWFSIGAIAVSAGVATPAAASDSFAINLRAQVAPFCRISAPEESAVGVKEGQFLLGTVRETCNAANGYVVRARVHNAVGGTLFAGVEPGQRSGEEYVFTRRQASRLEQSWRLADGRLSDPAAPVRLVVTISPI